VVRRVPLIFHVGNQIVPSLASEALLLAQGAPSYIVKSSNASGETAYGSATGVNHLRIGAFEVPTDADGAVWLRYRHSHPENFIPAWKVLRHKITPADVQGTIVLVGTSAAGLVDRRSTPLDEAIPGVEIHEQVIEHILSGQFLTRPDYARGLEIVLMLLAGIGLAVVFPRISAGTAALIGAGTIATFVFGGWALFRYEGLLLDSLYPSISTLLFVASATFYLYRRTERQRAEIRRAFGQYVAPEVVSHLVQNPERLVLGGEERELTLLFCDVRNYTNISEGLTAEELTTFINELLTPMTDIIMARMGTIDKYMGDAIMAFWNAPLEVTDHATRACDAALAMKRELVTLNEHWKTTAERKGRPYREVALGIGINTGVCCVGNLGSTQRFDYSAIGDNVNMASRFEGLTKFYGLPLVTGEETVKRGNGLPFLEVDLVRVKGKDRPSRIFTLLNLLDVDDEHGEALVAAHQQMLASYREADWTGAQQALSECRSFEIAGLHKLYELYEQRLSRYRLAPPPKDWSAVHVHEEK
jgi:adenylate cyclase